MPFGTTSHCYEFIIHPRFPLRNRKIRPHSIEDGFYQINCSYAKFSADIRFGFPQIHNFCTNGMY